MCVTQGTNHRVFCGCGDSGKIDADFSQFVRIDRLDIIVGLAVQRRPLQEKNLSAVCQKRHPAVRHLCDIANTFANFNLLNVHHPALVEAERGTGTE